MQAGNLFLRTGPTVLTVRLTDAQFPPYDQVIPRDRQREAKISHSGLLDALKRISLVASEKTYGLRLSLSKGTLRIESDNPISARVGKSSMSCTVGRLRHWLQRQITSSSSSNEIDTPEVILDLNGELDPGVVRPADEPRPAGQ